ncbi:hypothetical protein QL285_015360 [Trifolium repens]|nr:hypothetical protein QL285_015360 [Trifolium repens]
MSNHSQQVLQKKDQIALKNKFILYPVWRTFSERSEERGSSSCKYSHSCTTGFHVLKRSTTVILEDQALMNHLQLIASSSYTLLCYRS